jgi:hypothetical protein
MNESEINIYVEAIGGHNYDIKIDNIKFQKMLLLFNAVNDGWSVKKKNDNYIFSKNHEGKREILSDSYLLTFMKSNFDLNNLFV